MINVEKLRKERADRVKEMRALTDAARTGERRMSEEEGNRFQVCDDEVARLDGEIQRAERMNALEIQDQENEDRDSGGGTPPPAPKSAWGNLGEFLHAVRSAVTPGGNVDSRLIESRAALGVNEAVPSEGGFLVSSDLMSGISSRAYDSSLIAGRCYRQPIGATANGLMWNELDETSRAAGSRNGGIQSYWTSEAATITASAPNFAQRELKLDKLAALVYTTEEMEQDTVAMSSFISSKVSEELAFKLDDAIFRGTGAGMPLGLLNSDAVISVAAEGGQAADTIVWENLLSMRMRMWARSRPNAVWFINQDTEKELATMAFVVGTGGVPVYLPAGGASVDGYDRLFGRPVIPVEQCSTVGTVGDVVYADMSKYMLIEKGGVNTATSMHVQFVTHQNAYRFTLRTNGAPGPDWAQPLTPANGTNTVSPFVALASRA